MPQSKNCYQPLEAGRARSRFLPKSLQKERVPADTLISIQVYRFRMPGLQNCKVINFYCFKPPSCANLIQQSQDANIEKISCLNLLRLEDGKV